MGLLPPGATLCFMSLAKRQAQPERAENRSPCSRSGSGGAACRWRSLPEGHRASPETGTQSYQCVCFSPCVDTHFKPITVWNVAMMARTPHTGLFRRPSRQSQALVEAALERVGVDNLRDRPIGALSGGQQQRVFLARALAKQADLLILDEPFAGVDRAQAAGMPVRWYYLGMVTAISLTVVANLQTVGVLLVIAMLVAPGMTAFLLVKELHQMMLLGAVFGALAGIVGMYLSYYFELPSGSAIVLVSFGLFMLAFLFSPTQGILTQRR